MAIRAWVITDDYELIACGSPPTDCDWPVRVVDKRTRTDGEEETK